MRARRWRKHSRHPCPVISRCSCARNGADASIIVTLSRVHAGTESSMSRGVCRFISAHTQSATTRHNSSSPGEPLPRPHHHRLRSSPGRPRSGPIIALIRLRADKPSSQRCRSSTAVQRRDDWYGASHSPTSESDQSSIASTLSSTIQQGSPARAPPSGPSRTNSARKSANGPMSWRTLALSSAAM